MRLFDGDTSTILFLAGLTLMIVVLLRRSYRYFGRTGGKVVPPVEAVARPQRIQPATGGNAPRDAVRWQVEMHETARDLKAELDSKMGALQYLTLQAGQQADRLEAAIARAEQLGIAPCRDTLEALQQITAEPVVSDPDTIPSLPVGNLPTELPISDGRLPPQEDRRRNIYALADQGESPAAIADQVDAPIGDVEMMLNLRGRNE